MTALLDAPWDGVRVWSSDLAGDHGRGEASVASFTVRPLSADWRAAARISVTIRLFSSDERPAGFTRPRTTAIRYETASRSCAGSAAGIRLSSLFPGRRTRMSTG